MSQICTEEFCNRKKVDIPRMFERGLSLIAVHGIDSNGKCTCGKVDCASAGKHPVRAAWTEPENQARTIEDARRLLIGNPLWNVGVVTGPASGNVVVIDYDGGVAAAGENAARDYQKYKLENPYVAKTGNGMHVYLSLPAGKDLRNSVRRFGKADIRGAGGFVVAPPSRHMNGCSYEWLNFPDAGISEMPSEMFKAITRAASESQYGRTARENELAKLAATTEGQRNDALNKAAFSLAQLYQSGDLDEETTTEALCDAALALGSPLAEVRATLESGTHAGKQKPRPPSSSGSPGKKKKGTKLQVEDAETEIVRLSDVEMRQIDWLWHERIACGKVSVVAGNPGLGKSQLSANLAAIVTQGGEWPCGEGSAKKGSVLFLSAEDDVADTIKPRLVAANADVGKCYMLQAIRTKAEDGKMGQRCFDLTVDIERLGEELAKIGDVRLVVIDPITAYLGETDSNNNAEMRGLLLQLASMACRHNVAVVVLTHLNKSRDQEWLARVIGSIGLVAAARGGFIVIKDEEEPRKRYVLPLKNNNGDDATGFSFEIEGVTLENGIRTSRLRWHNEMVEAQKVLNPDRSENAPCGVTNWLGKELANGPVPAKEILDKGMNGCAYAKRTIQRAAERLGVISEKMGMEGGWVWRLPTLPEVLSSDESI